MDCLSLIPQIDLCIIVSKVIAGFWLMVVWKTVSTKQKVMLAVHNVGCTWACMASDSVILNEADLVSESDSYWDALKSFHR